MFRRSVSLRLQSPWLLWLPGLSSEIRPQCCVLCFNRWDFGDWARNQGFMLKVFLMRLSKPRSFLAKMVLDMVLNCIHQEVSDATPKHIFLEYYKDNIILLLRVSSFAGYGFILENCGKTFFGHCGWWDGLRVCSVLRGVIFILVHYITKVEYVTLQIASLTIMSKILIRILSSTCLLASSTRRCNNLGGCIYFVSWDF